MLAVTSGLSLLQNLNVNMVKINECFVILISLAVGNGNYDFKLKDGLDRSIELRKTYYEFPEIVIPMAVYIDYSLAQRYKHMRKPLLYIRRYVGEVIREITKKFQHPSLGIDVKFNVIEVAFLRNDSKIVSPNSKLYLRRFCEWQAMGKYEDDVWFSIVLTGLNLYYVKQDGSKVTRNEARSYMNGVCSVHKSCAVVEGYSKNIVHLLTHEIGHSLGMRHDGDKNGCTQNKHMMTPVFTKKSTPKSWSACSAKYLREFLKLNKAKCLYS